MLRLYREEPGNKDLKIWEKVRGKKKLPEECKLKVSVLLKAISITTWCTDIRVISVYTLR